jgi:hypothetical protein
MALIGAAMAGIGAAPKDKSERRNRAVPRRGEWVDLPPLEKPILPHLDDGYDDRVVAVWEAWRYDPVTAEWSSADINYARETIDLRASCWPAKAAEIRLRMDALGLTPKGKRDLRWRTPAEVAAAEKRGTKVRRLQVVERSA